ncbi:MAG: putative sugar kinase [Rhodobacteraceae bacterium HLUCCA12]|nr:MAG: putative sugar kinase [Rhodobacteraceae bacterium HLUCCA12]
MTELLTSAQMRAIEAAAFESGAASASALMERAGHGVADTIAARWGQGGRAVVLCGPGNNGGDGFVVARLLRERGWQVAVHAMDPGANPTPEAAQARARWETRGVTAPLDALDDSWLGPRTLVVDALFGTGLQRPLAASVWHPLARAQARGATLLAVDILSGLCADSGKIRAEGAFLRRPADLTLTFEAMKLGHVLDSGGWLSGPVQVVPIGIREELVALTQSGHVARLVEGPTLDLHKGPGHKFSHGHLLVLSGGPGHGGAARMAARAALRIGAGLVTLACPPEALAENAARLDAVMLAPIADAPALNAVLEDARINALCLGPGLGLDARAARLVAAALDSGRALVLDADALTLIARDPALMAALHDGCVLTPHAGEFARLFAKLDRRLNDAATPGPAFSRFDAARAAAAQTGATVLLKGPDTVIAAPSGRAMVQAAIGDRAAPWLATAGAGDVLAGMIAGLLARGADPVHAAETAAWLHVEAALAVGPGLIAEDLPEALPGVLRKMLGRAADRQEPER